jgi:large subunit ribosomal protein L13
VRPGAPTRPSSTLGPARAAAATESLGADLWNKTYYPTGPDAANLHKPWYIIDAEGQTLGRLATLAAMHIR